MLLPREEALLLDLLDSLVELVNQLEKGLLLLQLENVLKRLARQAVAKLGLHLAHRLGAGLVKASAFFGLVQAS